MNVFDAKGKPVWLGEVVGRGGEATVYRVRGQTSRLAKIYEGGPRPNYSEKLGWMVANPPDNPTRAIAHPSLAWPSDLLFGPKHRLAGYLMPYIHQAVPILEVFNPRRRQATLPRFDRRYLHRAARNLSATLTALHARGYVVGDLNENNVLVTPSALISLIDTDSFQVQELHGNQVVYHPCPVGKLEYTPPELHNGTLGKVVRQPEHDAFALGVLIFQLLMEGSHPFRAQWLGSGDPPPIEARIAQGIFPYTTTPNTQVRPPKGAPDLNHLHPALVELVLRCFTDGHINAQKRPTPEQWERALIQAENALALCPNRHRYSTHLSRCPSCQAATRKAAQDTPTAKRARGDGWRARQAPKAAGATSPQPAAAAPAKANVPPPQKQAPNTPPSWQAPPPKQAPKAPPSWQAPPPKQAPPPFQVFRPWTGISSINWRAFIASRLNNPWPQPAYPSGAPSRAGAGAAATSRPHSSAASPSQPRPVSQPWRQPAYQPVNLRAWAKPRLSKSLAVGGGQGVLIGALIGVLVAVASASTGEMAALILLWALGGAAAGVLRGWKPGYRMSVWVDSHLGWHRVLPVLGLLAGAMGGMLLGLIIGWWAVVPVFVGLFTGARLGKRAGDRIAELGNRLGWERIWAGASAGVAALIGWQFAAWLGGGAVGGLTAQGASSLVGWISGSEPSILLIAGISGALCGGLGGAVAGSLTDLVGRFAGLVD